MTERQGGILWRLARLHPGWVTLFVSSGWFIFGPLTDYLAAHPPLAVVPITGFMLFYMGYPLFVLLFVPGRFRSRSFRRPGRAILAFGFVGLAGLFSSIVDEEWFRTLLANRSSSSAIAFQLIWNLGGVAAFLYLFIGAAIALAHAEKGPTARFGRKLWTSLQFFYLPFCVFFIHRKLRNLIVDFENGDPIIANLPLEALKIERQAGGHLFLLLTERIGWEDFDIYAKELLHRLDGRVAETRSMAIRQVWNVRIETLRFRLVYDGHPNRVMLESESHAGDMLLKKLQARLAPDNRPQAEAVVSVPAT
jgi:Protein of unknown function (DUF3630)